MSEGLAQVLQQTRTRYYGKYRGFVVDNEDPETRGRIRVRVPSVLGTAVTDWALPCAPFGGAKGYGFFAVPDVDAQVWVEFEEGDVAKPIWTGTFWQTKDDAPETARISPPTTRVLETPGGHRLQFDDEDGKEHVRLHHSKDASLDIDPDGTVLLTDAGGATIEMNAKEKSVAVTDAHGNSATFDGSGIVIQDSSGNKVEMAASGLTASGAKIVVKGNLVALGSEGGEPLIKGTTFLAMFATHTHPVPSLGMSGPPVPQGTNAALSTKVTTG